tara:strand:- start:39 stop:200 length:162 start_codon:yes stop_codon:yes gene_type:complete
MNKFIIIIIFFLASCNTKTVKKDFNFSEDLSFEEFKIKLEEYAKNNPYPNIDD